MDALLGRSFALLLVLVVLVVLVLLEKWGSNCFSAQDPTENNIVSAQRAWGYLK